MMRRRSLNDDGTTVPAPPMSAEQAAQVCDQRVPMNERVQTIVCSIGDLRLALEADVAWSVRESARGRKL
jgi:hypothetical protein